MTEERPDVGAGGPPNVSRAATLTFIALMGMPFMFFIMLMAFDGTLTFTSAREVRDIATQAAVAGAYEMQPGTQVLDQAEAHSRAEELVHANASAGAMPGLDNYQPTVSTGPQQVTVTIDYEPGNLIFLTALTNLLPGLDITPQLSQTRTAYVCVPGDDTPTDGVCARPRP